MYLVYSMNHLVCCWSSIWSEEWVLSPSLLLTQQPVSASDDSDRGLYRRLHASVLLVALRPYSGKIAVNRHLARGVFRRDGGGPGVHSYYEGM